MAWGLFLEVAGNLRIAGMGVLVGVESGRAVERLVAAGASRSVAEDMIRACEAGFLTAMRERDGDAREN